MVFPTTAQGGAPGAGGPGGGPMMTGNGGSGGALGGGNGGGFGGGFGGQFGFAGNPGAQDGGALFQDQILTEQVNELKNAIPEVTPAPGGGFQRGSSLSGATGNGGGGGTGNINPSPVVPEALQWSYLGYAIAQQSMGYYSPYPNPGVSVTPMGVLSSIGFLNTDHPDSDTVAANEARTRIGLDKTVPAAGTGIELRRDPSTVGDDSTLGNPNATTYLGGNEYIVKYDNTSDGQGQLHNYSGGTDWVWGEWSRTQGVVSVTTYEEGAYTAGRVLTAAEFAAVRDGATVYDLYSSPIGRATAFVSQNVSPTTIQRRLDGTASLAVQIGKGNAFWSGNFALANAAGDTLALSVPTTPILPNGHLAGLPDAYLLYFNGGSYSPPTTATMTGSLVGPGPNAAGRPPVTGAIGTGVFQHGPSGPDVRLTYGTELRH